MNVVNNIPHRSLNVESNLYLKVCSMLIDLQIIKKAILPLLCLLLTTSVIAKTVQSSSFFEPLKNQWVLSDVTFANSFKSSTPRAKIVADGQTSSITFSLNQLSLLKSVTSATLLMSENIHSMPIWSVNIKTNDKIQLPTLIKGSYWFVVKAKNSQQQIVAIKHLYLSVIESQTTTKLQHNHLQNVGLTAWQNDNQLYVGFAGKLDQSTTLNLRWHKLDGMPLKNQAIKIGKAEKFPLTVSLDWLAPGITAYCKLAMGQDEYAVLIGKKGHYSKVMPPIHWPKAKRIKTFTSTDNSTAFGPYAKQAKGFGIMLDGMSKRGTDAVALGMANAQVQPLDGVYDWSEYDSYILELTRRKIPFMLHSQGGALFNTHPMDLWGQWMQTDHHQVRVWRNMMTVSPFADRYLNNAKQTVEHAIRRYRENPYLLGYNFINHGGDSYIYHDHFDRITDYGPQARKAFRVFVKSKYQNLASLNQAWGTKFATWNHVMPAVPNYNLPVNLHPAWQDFNRFRLKNYTASTTQLFDEIVERLDPKALIVHYVAYTGPVEYIYQKVSRDPSRWIMSDGGGEHHTMDRITSFARHYGLSLRSESHNVPPANTRYMKAVFTNALRYGTEQLHFGLVWNSTPSIHATHYPKRKDLHESMAWWAEAQNAFKQLANANVRSNKVAVMLSWEDLFYRKLAWRWYALPGEWSRVNLLSHSIANPQWVSAITPQKIWQQSDVMLAPNDAAIWSDEMVKQVQKYVASGKNLVVVGKSGQYALDGSDHFAWVQKLGGKMSVMPITYQSQTMQWNHKTYRITPTLVVKLDAGFKLLYQSKTVVRWQYGKGHVTWVLSGPSPTGDMRQAVTEQDGMEALIAELLKTSGANIEVQSSDPNITTLMLERDGKQYVLLSYYISMRKPENYQAVQTRITLPQIKTGNWELKNMIPSQAQPVVTTDSENNRGMNLSMLPGDCLLYEVVQ